MCGNVGGVQYRGGVSIVGDIMSTVRDILSTVGVFSTMGDTMIHVGDIMITVGLFSTVRGIMSTVGVFSTVGNIMSTVEGDHDACGEIS